MSPPHYRPDSTAIPERKTRYVTPPPTTVRPRTCRPHLGRVRLSPTPTGSDCWVRHGRQRPHRWQHTYATSLVRRGEDIHVVWRLMGRSNIATTTTRYLHLLDADLLDAVDRAFPES